jgi:HPt (histidine-containing phosphotransfer) domain-containing protein
MPGASSPGPANSSAQPSSSAGQPPAAPPRVTSTAELLSRLWHQNLPIVRERVACLERAAQHAETGELAPALKVEASDLAHKLAGSLGMFGYPRGTDIAREIEHMLEHEAAIDGQRFVRLAALRSVLSL